MKEFLMQLFGDAVTEDVLKQFNAEIGKRFVAKTDYNAKLEEIKTLKGKTKDLEDKISELNETASNNEDVKAELDALKSKIETEKKQAEADRILAEKTESIKKRFEAVLGDKKFNHDAIKADYLKKFSEAIELEENKSKSDADIFHDLTKDDATAFTGVTAVKLAGGKPQGVGGKQYTTKEEIMSIKDSTERLSAIQANPNLFRKE